MNLISDTVIQVLDLTDDDGPTVHAEKPPGRDEVTLTVTDDRCRQRWYGTADDLRAVLGLMWNAVDEADGRPLRVAP